MKCVICCDSGGTKTEVVAYSLSGEEIVTEIGGSGNFSFETEKAVENVISTIDKVYAKLNGMYQCLLIQMGIAGYGSFKEKEAFINRLKEKYHTDISIVDDAKLALYSVLKDKYQEAILVLAGTGSACYGINESKELLVGGWGHLLGDEGGAHNLVLRVFKKMVDDEDEGKKPSALASKILNHLHLDNVFDLKKYVYNNSKAEIAKLAQFINQCAQYDELARQFLKDSALDLANFAYLVYKRLNLSPSITIGCQGSFILNSQIVKKQFQEAIFKLIPDANIIEVNERPVKGAYYLAKKILSDGGKLCM